MMNCKVEMNERAVLMCVCVCCPCRTAVTASRMRIMTVFRVQWGSSRGASTRSVGGTRTVTLSIGPQCRPRELQRVMPSVGPAYRGEQPRHNDPHNTTPHHSAMLRHITHLSPPPAKVSTTPHHYATLLRLLRLLLSTTGQDAATHTTPHQTTPDH